VAAPQRRLPDLTRLGWLGWRGPAVALRLGLVTVLVVLLVGGVWLGERSGPNGHEAKPAGSRRYLTTPHLTGTSAWQVVQATGDPNAPVIAACPSGTTCFGLGSINGTATFNVSTDFGAYWAGVGIVGTMSVSAVACPTAGDCVIAGQTGGRAVIVYSHDAGHTWTAARTPAEPGAWRALSCDASHCVAFGSGRTGSTTRGFVAVSDDAGGSWRSGTPASPPGQVTSVACPSPGVCVALAGATGIGRSTNGGSSWTWAAAPNPAGVVGSSLSCAAPTSCRAFAGAGAGAGGTATEVISTVDGGATWSAAATSGALPRSVSVVCTSVSRCLGYTVDGLDVWSPDGGVTWHLAQGAGAGRFAGSPRFVCDPARACAISGATSTAGAIETDVTTDGGASYSSHEYVPPPASLIGIACSTPQDCVATGILSIGTSSVALVTHDGGSQWLLGDPFPQDTALSSPACTSPTRCIADGRAGILSTANGGIDWASGYQVDRLSVGSVACSGPSLCVLVATDASGPLLLVSRDGGSTWSAPQRVTGLAGSRVVPRSVSCTGEHCVAVGTGPRSAVVMRSADAGSTWTAVQLPAEVAGLVTVQCGASGWCVAAGADADASPRSLVATSTDFGATWTVSGVGPDTNDAVQALACSSPSDCLVLLRGREGLAPRVESVTGDGRSWSEEPLPGYVDQLYGLTCTGSGSCFVVGSIRHEGSIILKGALPKP